jgi:hypothetical protein
VLSQDPAAGSLIAPGSPVALVVSSGPPAAAPPSFQGGATGGASGASVTTSTALPGTSGQLYVAAVATRPYQPVTAMSGLGLTWTPVAAQCSGRFATGVDVWIAQGPTAGGTVAATLAGSVSNVVIAVSAYAGAAAPNPVGASARANSNGVNGACSGGTDGTAYAIPLTTSVPNALIYSAATMRNKTHAPGAMYTERHDLRIGSGGDTVSVATQDGVVLNAAPVIVDGSFNITVDWAVIAIEIRPN